MLIGISAKEVDKIQQGICKPNTSYTISSHDVIATIGLDKRQTWEYEIAPDGSHYRLHYHNVAIAVPREQFENGWEIVQKEGQKP